MYRRIALAIALAVGVLSLSLVNSDSTARAQKQNKYTWDTGVVTLGPNQILRITVALGETGTHEVVTRFRSMQYTPGACNGGVCKHTVASQTTSAPVSLTQDGGASMDVVVGADGNGVRGMVLSNNQNLRVNALIINTITGEAGATVNLTGESQGQEGD
jgi:hypothetical protein